MSLSDLASLGSFVSGIAVTITLVFLLFQMRQSNINQRALMQQERASRASDVLLRVSEPGMNEAWVKGVRGDESISDSEYSRFFGMFRATQYGFEDVFFQHRSGLLHKEVLDSTTGTIQHLYSFPGWRAAWETNRGMHEVSFQKFIDGVIATMPRTPPANQRERWLAKLANERKNRPDSHDNLSGGQP